MKDMFWKTFMFLSIMTFSLLPSKEALAEVCSLGDIYVEVAPSYLSFDIKPGECRLGERILGTVRLMSKGKEETVVLSIDEDVSVGSSNVFMAMDENKHAAVALPSSAPYTIAFQPMKYGSYSGVLTYTYAYGMHPLIAYADCIKRTLGAEVKLKKKIVDEMMTVGPNFKMIETRIARAKEDHVAAVDKLNQEKAGLSYKISVLDREMREAVEEMRDGEFCSDCGGTRSEFEKTNRDFDAHIREGASGGRHKRGATIEELNKKEEEYAAKKRPIYAQIDGMKAKYDAAELQLKRNLENIEAQRQTLIKAFNERLTSLREKVTSAQKRFEEAMADHEKMRLVRKTTTSQVGGTCRAK